MDYVNYFTSVWRGANHIHKDVITSSISSDVLLRIFAPLLDIGSSLALSQTSRNWNKKNVTHKMVQSSYIREKNPMTSEEYIKLRKRFPHVFSFPIPRINFTTS